MEIKKSRAWA